METWIVEFIEQFETVMFVYGEIMCVMRFERDFKSVLIGVIENGGNKPVRESRSVILLSDRKINNMYAVAVYALYPVGGQKILCFAEIFSLRHPCRDFYIPYYCQCLSYPDCAC